MKIGDHILGASEDGSIIIDGLTTTFTTFKDTQHEESITSTVTTLAGYTLAKTLKGRKSQMFIFELDLDNVINIRTNTKNRIVYVDAKGHYEGSVSSFGAPAGEDDINMLLSRDGSLDLIENWK